MSRTFGGAAATSTDWSHERPRARTRWAGRIMRGDSAAKVPVGTTATLSDRRPRLQASSIRGPNHRPSGPTRSRSSPPNDGPKDEGRLHRNEFVPPGIRRPGRWAGPPCPTLTLGFPTGVYPNVASDERYAANDSWNSGGSVQKIYSVPA